MSDQLDLNIKAGDTKLLVTVSADATVLDLKQAVAAKDSSFSADALRLIFSGRVLKDEDKLEKYGVKNGVAIHAVKGSKPAGAASTAGAGASAARSSEAAGVPANFAAGQQVAGNPLAPLMNAQYAGAFGGFNPFAEMGVNPNDPNYLQNLMQSPEAQAAMNRALADPAIVDQIIASNPQLQAMGPQVRQMMQSEHFRNFLTNPQLMQQMMGSMGSGAGGGGAFPPPGAFGWGSGAQGAGQGQQGGAATGGTGGGLFNPWASNPALATGETGAAAGAGSPPPANPFGGAGGFDPMAALAQLQGIQNLFGGMGGAGGAAPGQPQQNPEERYAAELAQLQAMGFTDASKNVRAIQAAGGYVESAVQWLLEN
ncbi:hypothetical protein JCM8547_007885 [Rhodosporidiobolus lusitaniae]